MRFQTSALFARPLLGLAMVLCVVGPVSAQIPQEAWDAFVEHSFSRNRTSDSPARDLEDHLYEAARSHASEAAVLADFAARIGVGPDVGAEYAALIIEAVRRRAIGCGSACPFAPGDAFYDRLAELAGEPTGMQLLMTIHDELDRRSILRHDGWLGLLMRRPDAASVLSRWVLGGEIPYLVAMLAIAEPHEWHADAIAHVTEATFIGSDKWDGWLDSFLEAAEHRATEADAPLDIRVALAEAAIRRELELGLIDGAVHRYLAYPHEIRELLPVGRPPARSRDPRCIPEAPERFIVELAAALWQTGHHSEARTLIGRRSTSGQLVSAGTRDRYAALADLMSPTIAAADLFDRYFVPPPATIADLLCGPRPWSGWFDAVVASPSLRPLASARLREAGYLEAARVLESKRLYPRDDEPGVLSGYARYFPESIQATRERWSHAIDRAWHSTRPPERSVQVRGPARLPDWPERALPDGMPVWDRADDKRLELPDNLRLPVGPWTLIRYEALGPEHAIVYRSDDLDKSGPYQFQGRGIWFARTEGGRWTKPVYLGLSETYPYRVMQRSALPMLIGNVLRLEVTRDRGWRLQPVRGIYLEIDLDEARADRDDDALSDIEEHVLGLDPADPDSDGDGLSDGTDPLPFTAYRADLPVSDLAAIRAIVGYLRGQEAPVILATPDRRPVAMPPWDVTRSPRDTLMLIGDPDLFAGIAGSSFPIVIYRDEDLEVLARGPALFRPVRIHHLIPSLDRRRHYVQWSNGNSAGSFIVTCAPAGGACKVEQLRLQTE